MDASKQMQSSTERYLLLRIEEIKEDLTHLPNHYPDTYGKAFAHWQRCTETSPKSHKHR